jgi:hypothetical protein
MKRNGANKAFADLMAPYSPEVRSLALATRTFLLEAIPGATEQVDAKSKVVGYGFGPKYTDMVCSIMPNKGGITLGIGWGTELPDPDHLLEGAGKVHRHVKLKSKRDLEIPALNALLQAALTRRKKLGLATEA